MRIRISRLDSLRARFLAAMVGVVMVGFFAMVIINRTFGEQMVRTHAESLAEQGLLRMTSQLQAITRNAVRQSDALEELVRRAGDEVDPVSVLQEMAPLFLSQPSITYAGLAMAGDGRYAFLQRTAERTVVMREYGLDDQGHRFIRDTELDQLGQVTTAQLSPWDGYDPRTRPFYEAARKMGRRVWTDSYRFRGNVGNRAAAGVTLATPIYDEAGQLRVVVDVDFGTTELSRFVQVLQRGLVGRIFVLEERKDQSRRVVVHSGGLPGMVERGGALNADPLVAAASRAFGGTFAEMSADRPAAVLLTVEGQPYVATARFLQGKTQPRWMVVSVLPVASVRLDLDRLQRITMLSLAAIALAGVGFSWLLAAGLSRPLSKLAGQVKNWAAGNTTDEVKFGPVEVRQLAEQFQLIAGRVASREQSLLAAEAMARSRTEQVQRAHDTMLAAAREILKEKSDPSVHFERLMALMMEALPLRQVLIWRVEEAENGLRCVGRRGQPVLEDEAYSFWGWDEMPRYRAALEEEGWFLSTNAVEDPLIGGVYRRRKPVAGAVALLDVAIKAQGRFAGVLSLQRVSHGTEWPVEAQMLARGMADIIAILWERHARLRAEATLRQQIRQVGRINEVLQASSRLLAEGGADERSMLVNLARSCAQILDVTRVSIWRRVGKTNRLEMVIMHESSSRAEQEGVVLEMDQYPEFWDALCRDGLVAVADMAADPRTARLYADHLTRRGKVASLDASAALQGEVKGGVSFHQIGAARPWTPEDEIAVRSVAETVAVLFEWQARLQAEAQVRQQASRLLRANEITHEVALGLAQSNLAEGIERVLESTLELLEAWRVSVWRVKNGESEMVLVSMRQRDGEVRRGDIQIQRRDHEAYLQHLEREGRVVIADAETDPLTQRVYAERLRGDGQLSILDTAIVVGGRTTGLFSVHRREGAPWTPEDELVARAMTDLLAFVFEREAREHAEATIEQQAHRLVRHSEVLAELTRELRQTETVHAALQLASVSCASALDAEFVVVWLESTAHGVENRTYVYNAKARKHVPGVAVSAEVFEQVKRRLEQDRCLVVPNSADDADFGTHFLRNLPELPLLNMLVTAIVSGDRIIGLVGAQTRDLQRDWQPDERLFLSAVTDVVSLRVVTLAQRDSESR